jgi:hypothetical protein
MTASCSNTAVFSPRPFCEKDLGKFSLLPAYQYR